MPNQEGPRSYQLLQQAFTALKWNFYYTDNLLSLSPQARRVLSDFTRSYYRVLWRDKYRARPIKKRLFDLDYDNHPDRYPALLNPDMTAITNLGPAVPGNDINAGVLAGYFSPIKDPEGRYYLNRFLKPVMPFEPFFSQVENELLTVLSGMPPASGPAFAERKNTLEMHLADVRALGEYCRNIGIILRNDFEQKHASLSSGHLLSTVSGMNLYAAFLSSALTEMGYNSVLVESDHTIIQTLGKTRALLSDALDAILADCLMPLAQTIGHSFQVVNGRVILMPYKDEPRGFLDSLITFITALFGKKPKKCAPETAPEKPDTSKCAPEPEPKHYDGPPFQHTELLSAVFRALRKITDALYEDLSPVKGAGGTVTDYRAGFDQFDLLERDRRINYTYHNLSGKLIVDSSDSARYVDETVVDSTYWIYDRMMAFLEVYETPGGMSRLKARAFADELRDFVSPVTADRSDERRFVSLHQLRINVRRIFASPSQHSRYNSMINNLVQATDALRAKTRD